MRRAGDERGGAPALAPAASADPPTYNSNSSTLLPNQTNVERSGCPVGRSDIVGGGVFITGSSLEVEVKASGPIDDNSDNDKQPDDYWNGWGNAGPSQETITTHAICSKAPVRYEGAGKRVDPGTESAAKPRCAGDRNAISGGVSISSNASTEVRLMASTPASGDRWRGRIVNGSPDQVKMKVWAICADAKTRGKIAASTPTPSFLNNTQSSLSTSSCSSAKYKVTGVGAEVIGTPPGTEVASLIPSDLDAGTDPDDGATAWFNNQSGVAQRMRVTAVCAKL